MQCGCVLPAVPDGTASSLVVLGLISPVPENLNCSGVPQGSQNRPHLKILNFKIIIVLLL